MITYREKKVRTTMIVLTLLLILELTALLMLID